MSEQLQCNFLNHPIRDCFSILLLESNPLELELPLLTFLDERGTHFHADLQHIPVHDIVIRRALLEPRHELDS